MLREPRDNEQFNANWAAFVTVTVPDAIGIAAKRWLIAEFCAHSLFNGWHLYLRDTDRHERNTDGSWGWLQRGHHLLPAAHAVLADLRIATRPGSDGSCDDDGYAELARRYPIRRSRVRGGVAVQVDDIEIDLVTPVRRAVKILELAGRS